MERKIVGTGHGSTNRHIPLHGPSILENNEYSEVAALPTAQRLGSTLPKLVQAAQDVLSEHKMKAGFCWFCTPCVTDIHPSNSSLK